MEQKIDFLEELGNFNFISKYARYNELMSRRETWEECVHRVEKMHTDKFKYLPKEDLDVIKWAFDLVRQKRIVPSMRALDINTPINTKDGWKKAGDIKCNDILYDSLGNETTVKDTVLFNNKDLYKITFSDHSSLTACDEHLWIVSTSDDRNIGTTRVVDTKFLRNHYLRKGDYISKSGKQNNIYNITIKNAAPVNYIKKELLVDPYILGLWLGDGCKHGYSIACSVEESEFIIEQYRLAGYSGKQSDSSNIWCWHIHGLTKDLQKYNLPHNKHIPEIYLRGDFQQRLSLVQGLIDSGGCVSTSGVVSFYNINNNLISGLKELLSSLGIKYTQVNKPPRDENCSPGTEISFTTSLPVVRLPEKLKRLKKINSKRNQYRSIRNIEYIGKGAAICFHVNSPDNSFLAGSNMITTHNSMQFGGKAIEAHHARMFNCVTRHVDTPRAFAELFYALLAGCGIGIGLSKKYINRLPDLVGPKDKTGSVIAYTIQDSIEGWADSVEALLMSYFKNTAYSGRKIIFDYSKIRPEGSPVKTGGGKAPGYKGLKRSLLKIKELLDHLIEDNQLNRLRSVDVYDILMHCADACLSGGIRRSASSCIFEKDDIHMLNAKTYFTVSKHTKFSYDDETKLHYGKVTVNSKKYDVELPEYDYNQLKTNKTISWFYIEPQRARSNNSVLLLRNETTFEEFQKINKQTREFGEPGFVWANIPDQLYNPCFETGQLPITDDGVTGLQGCNLTSINGLLCNTKELFFESVKGATIIGTLQSAYTDFKYLGNATKRITDHEALLGVSIAGMMNNPEILLDPNNQQEGAKIACETNEIWAKKINVNPSARITCIKPDGNLGATLGCASGIHPYHARRFIRRVQCNKHDPVYKFFKKHNPHACELSVWSNNKTDDVISFPVTVPVKAMIKSDLTALKHLELIKSTQQNWVIPGTSKYNKIPVTHNVSCTVLVDEHEWDDVFKYIYDYKQFFSAVSLLPKTGDKIYKQAPMEAIITEEDEKKWNELISKWKHVNYKQLMEDEDSTKATDTVACAGGNCENV